MNSATPSPVREISGHNRDIMRMTGCNEDDAGMIQDIMRNFIFHSTLDWQTAEQLKKAALEAKNILEEDRSPWEEFRRACKQIFEEGKRAEQEAAIRKKDAPFKATYEI